MFPIDDPLADAQKRRETGGTAKSDNKLPVVLARAFRGEAQPKSSGNGRAANSSQRAESESKANSGQRQKMDPLDSYSMISRRAMAGGRAIVASSLGDRDENLKRLLNIYLPIDGTSEYAFIFAVAYGEIILGGFRRIEGIVSAINLLQASTFVVDDVLDEATTRYDVATIWAELGAGMAVSSGILMQSIAVDAMLVETRRRFPRHVEFVLETANSIIKDVYQGQIMDVARPAVISYANYERMIAFTTGNFFQNVARLGARLGQRSSKDSNALEQFAYCYGMALQITDDVVDIVTNKIFTGKDAALDVVNRRPRLPMILALKLSGHVQQELLLAYLRTGSSKDDPKQIIDIIKGCGAIEKTIEIARGYIERGQSALNRLSDASSREQADYLLANLLQTQLLE